MPKFTDNAGREWRLDLNMWHVKRVRDVTGIRLMDLKKDGVFAALSDPVAVVDVLWVILEKEAGARKLTQEDFAKGLVGDTFEAASDALTDAVVDLFPSPKRKLLEKGIKQVRRECAELAAAVDAPPPLDTPPEAEAPAPTVQPA